MRDKYFLFQLIFIYFGALRSVQGREGICVSQACHEAAWSIKYNMDSSVDPCENFYDFACGGYINKTHIPEDKQDMTPFGVIEDNLFQQLLSLFNRGSSVNEPRFSTLAKDYFDSCMNENLLNERGLEPMKDFLREIGDWPILKGEEWSQESEFSWFKDLTHLRERGYPLNSFLSFYIKPNLHNSSALVIELDQPNLEIKKELWVKKDKNSIVNAYKEYLRDTVELFGGNIYSDFVQKEMRDILNFEESLAGISLLQENRRDSSKLYHPMRLRDLTILDPNNPWNKIINDVLGERIVQITDDELMNVAVPSFISNFSKLMNITPKRVQANYLVWQLIRSKMDTLNSEALRIMFKYLHNSSGMPKTQERWRFCVEKTQRNLDNAVGALYVRNFFGNDAKRGAEIIVKAVRDAFTEGLRTSSWIDATTKAQALEKIKGITEHIAYPQELLDDSKLNERYDALFMHPDEFFENDSRINKFNRDYSFSKLKQRIDKKDWVKSGNPTVINAFYDPPTNSIYFPAGILQGTIFARDRPQYLNFGSLGWIAGHEITHGFDDLGSQFDKDGNLRNWWEVSTKKDFQTRSQCIIDQYDKFELYGLKVNGMNTQGENIADNGGIKFAYQAYENWLLQTQSQPQRLPGLNYSPKQLFWISAANVWCGKFRSKAMKHKILVDEHSPPMFRIIGSLSNNNDFSNDFQCSKHKRMYPLKRCEVW